MRLVTFRKSGRSAPGLLLDGERILDLSQLAAIGRPATLHDVIASGVDGVTALGRAAAAPQADAIVRLAEIELLAPIPRPAKNVFCVGRNYVEHVAEGYRTRGTEMKLPEVPQFFTKPATAVIGPEAEIPLDETVTQRLDYEVELAVVIGRRGRNISRAGALSHVFGYTIVNDVTARDLQRRHDQWFKGKGLDGSCPMGPHLVHASAIADPQKLAISLKVNGGTRQSANTSMMIFDLPAIIESLSAGMTLEPGDVIATGTPSGVGNAMTPPGLLKDGDLVEAEIEGIGVLRNRVRRVEHLIED